MRPKQHIQGWVEFYKLKFKVTPDVLIPRPETELLVDEVFHFIRDYFGPNGPRNDVIASAAKQSLTILDIGTGSGNIAISTAKNLATSDVAAQIIATDISPQALKVAQQNAKLHQVKNQITFIQSNLLDGINNSKLSTLNSELIIVSNLPYIPAARIPYLDSSVKDFEPHVALDGGEDGFGLYRTLFQQIIDKKLKPSLIVGEIDYTHGELAQIETQKYFPKAQIEVKKDLAHKQRIILIHSNDLTTWNHS